MRITPRKRLGFTLIELAITTVIFGIIMGATVEATLAARSGSEAAMTRSTLDQRVQRVIDVVFDEFATAGSAGLSPTAAAPLGSDHMSYRSPTGIAGGAIVWDAASSVVFEYGPTDPNNGIDDDGDGWVDEGRIVLVRQAGTVNETRTVLCDGVPELMPGETANGADDNGNGLSDEKGLAFTVSGRTLIVRVAVGGTDRHARQITSVQSISVQLRN